MRAGDQQIVALLETAKNQIDLAIQGLHPSEDDPIDGINTNIGIAFIIGHTKDSPGAYSKTFDMHEYDFWSDEMTNVDLTYPDNKKFTYDYFRRDRIGISGAYKEAEKFLEPFKNKFAIELHFNAYNGTARGSEVLYVGGEKKLAGDLSAMFASHIKTKDRGAKSLSSGDRGHYNVSRLDDMSIQSILTEPFFGDNVDDCHGWAASREAIWEDLFRIVQLNCK